MKVKIYKHNKDRILKNGLKNKSVMIKKYKAKIWAKKMARETGLEPATSTVTGWHSDQLSYSPAS